MAGARYRLQAASRPLNALAWGLWALSIVMTLAGYTWIVRTIPVRVWAHVVPPELAWLGVTIDLLADVCFVAFATIGLILLLKQPRNRMGPLMLAVGLFGSANTCFGNYALFTFHNSPATTAGEPLVAFGLWVQHWAWLASIVAGLVVLPLLFPNGRVVSPGWLPFSVLATTAEGVDLVLYALTPGPVGSLMAGSGIPNPFGIAALSGPVQGIVLSASLLVASAIVWTMSNQRRLILVVALLLAVTTWISKLADVGGLILVVALLGAMTSVIARLRRTTGDERQQTKWLAVGLVASCVSGATLIVHGELDALGIVFFYAFTFASSYLAFAAAPALFKYRLYDLDLLINRSLVYGALTVSVVGMYIAIVGGIGALFHAPNNLAASLTATGIIAVAFNPLRDWLQRGVNRLMFGERDDPVGVLTRLAQELETADSAPAVLPSLAQTIATALRLPYVAMWLWRNEELVPVVEYGQQPAQAGGAKTAALETIPLLHQSAEIGKLVIAPRAPGEKLSAADQRLLTTIGQLAATTARTVQLTEELQASRGRVITAREEERRRIRRDLHDGLGPVLASQGLKLAAARRLMHTDMHTADRLMSEVIEQGEKTVTEVRRLVYALRPPTLDEMGLLEAIREYVAGMHITSGAGTAPLIVVDAPELLSTTPIPAAVEVAAFRIVQEALNNVARHAQASRCVVRIALSEELELEIADDGVGLPAQIQAGIGLLSMRERAREIGGLCVIEPVPGGGTRVAARLPL